MPYDRFNNPVLAAIREIEDAFDDANAELSNSKDHAIDVMEKLRDPFDEMITELQRAQIDLNPQIQAIEHALLALSGAVGELRRVMQEGR